MFSTPSFATTATIAPVTVDENAVYRSWLARALRYQTLRLRL
jgi:hypothetical protein